MCEIDHRLERIERQLERLLGREGKALPTDRGFFRLAELADRWGLSNDTIKRLIESGKVPVRRVLGLRARLIPASFVYQQEQEKTAQR